MVLEDRRLTVVRDDLLEGSTKQRGATPWLMRYLDYSEFVYAGSIEGYGHLCIAIVAETLKKKCTLFLQAADNTETSLVAASRSHGARIVLIPNTLKITTEEATKYVARTVGSLLVPLGMDVAEYQCHMVRAIREALPPLFASPKRMWVVVGSGRLLLSLQEIFPETEFLSVQVGRSPYNKARPTYISKYKLKQEVTLKDTPPYPASKTYEAKLWPFIREFARDGDWIWNAAR